MIRQFESQDILPLGQSSLIECYLWDFENCYSRRSADEVRLLSLLSPASCRAIWNPDFVALATHEWRKTQETDYAAAEEVFAQRLAVAKQTYDCPRMFLRRLEQLSSEVFPFKAFTLCPMLRQGFYGVPGPVEPVEERDFFYTASYYRGLEWLQSLPIRPEEEVYVGRSSINGLVMRYSEFLTHWDAFYCDRFCTLNVCDETNDWFIMMHPERFCVYGRKDTNVVGFDPEKVVELANVVDFGAEIFRLHRIFDGVRAALIAEYIGTA